MGEKRQCVLRFLALAAAGVVAVWLSAAQAAGDEITLTNGVVITGKIVDENIMSVSIRTTHALHVLSRSRIREIRKEDTKSTGEEEGDILFFQKDAPEEALKKYEAALKTGKNVEEVQRKIDLVQEKIKERKQRDFDERLKHASELAASGLLDDALALLANFRESLPEGESFQKSVDKERSKIHLQKAEQYRNNVNYRDALKEIREAIRIDEENVEAWLQLGELRINDTSGDPEGIEAYEKALSLLGKEAQNSQRYVDVRYSLALAHLRNKNSEKAAKEFTKVVESSFAPGFPRVRNYAMECYVKMAQEARASGDLEEAVSHLETALEVNPESAETHFLLAQIQRERGGLEEAMKALERTLEISPQYPGVHYFLAQCYLGKGENDAALEELKDEVRVSPFHYNALCELGDLLFEGAKYDEALACYERAQRIRPAAFHAYLGLGRTFRRQKKYREAVRNLEEVLEREPAHSVACMELGLVYKLQEDLPKAKELFETVERGLREKGENLGPKEKTLLAEVLARKGEVRLSMNAPRGAMEDFQESLSLIPDYPDAYNGLGEVSRLNGRYEEAEEHFLQAIKLDPTQPNFYLNLGILYHEFFRQPQKALKQYEEYIRRGGTDAAAVNLRIEQCSGQPIEQ